MFLAIALSVFVFAPERLPAGYGFYPVPVELEMQRSLPGKLIEQLTGNQTRDLVLTNVSERPIHNLVVTLYDKDAMIKKQSVTSSFPAAQQMQLNWADNWIVETGDQLEVKASTYYQVKWAL